MGLLDRAFDMLGDHHLPLMDARTRLLQAALALIANNGQTGGLHGLVERFQEEGVDDIIRSWISAGPNMAVASSQMEKILGKGQLKQIAEETGYTEHETAEHLSVMLPDLIDQLTPAGQIPQGGVGNMSLLLDHFMGGYH